MATKLFCALALIALVSSCSSQSNKVNFGQTKSNLRNISFVNIDNLKESQSCLDGSTGFLRLLASTFTFGLYEVVVLNYANLHEDDKYEYFSRILVDRSGDASISTATKLGGITKVKMVDHSYSITGIMSRRYCVIVYGE